MELIRIIAAQAIKGFTVRLTFSDGTEKTVDLEPYFHGPIFEPVRKDPQMFQTMRVDRRMGTIVWENGADIDPDVLYHGLKPAWMESEHRMSPSYKTGQDVQKVAEPKPREPSANSKA
jgi:hypothetical protein